MKRSFMLLIVLIFGLVLVGCNDEYIDIENDKLYLDEAKHVKYNEEQIKNDYLIYAHSIGEKHLTIENVEILNNYGQFDNVFIVRMNRGAYQVITYVSFMELGIKMQFSDSNTPLVYKEGEFYELHDAYKKGIVTKENLIQLKITVDDLKM